MGRNKVTFNYQPGNVFSNDRAYIRDSWIRNNLAAIQILIDGDEARWFYDAKLKAGQTDFYIYYRYFPDNTPEDILRHGGIRRYMDTIVAKTGGITDHRMVYVIGNEWNVLDETVFAMLEDAIIYAQTKSIAIGIGGWAVGTWEYDNMPTTVLNNLMWLYNLAANSKTPVHDICHEYAAMRDIKYVGPYNGKPANFDYSTGNYWLLGRFIRRWQWLRSLGVRQLPVAVLEGGYDDAYNPVMQGHRANAVMPEISSEKMYSDLITVMNELYDIQDKNHPLYDFSQHVTCYALYCLGNGGMGTGGGGDWKQFNYGRDASADHTYESRTDFFKLLENYYGEDNTMYEDTLTVLVPKLNVRNQPNTGASTLVGEFLEGTHSIDAMEQSVGENGAVWLKFTSSRFTNPVYVALQYNNVVLATYEVAGQPEPPVDDVILTEIVETLARITNALEDVYERLEYLEQKEQEPPISLLEMATLFSDMWHLLSEDVYNAYKLGAEYLVEEAKRRET